MTTLEILDNEYKRACKEVERASANKKAIEESLNKEKKRIARREKVEEELIRLDTEIWKKYHPEDTKVSKEVKGWWLKEDIGYLLAERDCDIDERFSEIEKIINSSEYAEDISEKFSLKLSCYDVAALRRDLASTLKKYKDISDLSSDLNYSFTHQDIRDFVALHRKNRFRKKIEDLLTNCNFHYECSMMCNKKYDELLEYLDEEDKKSE